MCYFSFLTLGRLIKNLKRKINRHIFMAKSDIFDNFQDQLRAKLEARRKASGEDAPEQPTAKGKSRL